MPTRHPPLQPLCFDVRVALYTEVHSHSLAALVLMRELTRTGIE